jgi:16S rRNA (guanine966-N2)-methyltransferase
MTPPLRIIAGAWRGRAIASPGGATTRPSSIRVRQALFDILLHASWAEEAVTGWRVLDVFAGSGALGFEALSRGAEQVTFLENDPAACAVIQHNIHTYGVADRATVNICDALSPPRGLPHPLALIDPPYGRGFVPRSIIALGANDWIVPGTIIAAEFGREDPIPTNVSPLIERVHGAARLVIWRHSS